MATFNLPRFSDPEVLKRIERCRLIELLKPHREFFEAQGIFLPRPGELDFTDYGALFEILRSPNEHMPREFLDTFFFLHALSTEEAMEGFLEVREIRDRAGENPTPVDVAALVWLQDRKELEQKYAQLRARRRRSFDYFLAVTPGRLDRLEPRRVAALEGALDRWFRDNGRGRGCRVFPYRQDDEVWFLIYHGGLFRREGTLVEGKPSSVYFRPEKFDLLVYNGNLGELRVNAPTKGRRQLYREMFGLHLFGDVGHFPHLQKYTLDPLRTKARRALACTGIDGLEGIVLTEIQQFRGGRLAETVIRKSPDLFAVLESRNETIDPEGRLDRANFVVKFTDSDAPIPVTVRPPNIAKYTHNGAPDRVEQWLQYQGFVRGVNGE